MIITRSPRFDRAYKKLPKNVKEQFKNKIRLLVETNYTHPSLRIKKIQGTDSIWKASIDMNHCFTFEKAKNEIKLRLISKRTPIRIGSAILNV